MRSVGALAVHVKIGEAIGRGGWVGHGGLESSEEDGTV
jgi:hypothetical protein